MHLGRQRRCRCDQGLCVFEREREKKQSKIKAKLIHILNSKDGPFRPSEMGTTKRTSVYI